eukprot:CAMPEP_0114688732 /NCGR_PEP_ID=MMETSP0191-20121206/63788_1 /TAXON_ID=126664 /ORGANISM="Sorites sp." /LENGTH=481 /DNA_ID=CAMNT_0001976541 /DNA_START=70 /DNA_END=1511 /DNA_ORIENTATION=-
MCALPLALGGLVEDLSEVLGESRAQQLQRGAAPLEAELRATVKALPKTPSGCLAPASARYALHRLFVEKGWFVKGLQELDPSRERNGHLGVNVTSASPVVILQDQVPHGVKALFEQRLQNTGLCLSDLAMLAALLEDLVHRETMHRVSAAFRAKKVPLVGKVSVEQLGNLLDYVMMSYILEVANLEGTNLDQQDVSLYLSGKRPMEEVYPNWPKTAKFLRDIQGVVAPKSKGSLTFDEITHVVEEIHEHYGKFHDEVDCQDMKQVLLGMERCPGRVDLSRFYAASLYEDKWQFSESVDYLRDLSALDTSSRPRVVVSNYVLGASNCIGTSRFYAQCCVDPCDQLMAKLEKALQAPEAPAASVHAAIKAVLPPTAKVQHRLEEIAHDGMVVLHGRLFAQWMHHAYPQDCPMPPAVGFRLYQELPKDYSLRTGQDYVATEKEMKHFAPSKRALETEKDDTDCKLPWTNGEELLDERQLQMDFT